MTTQVKDPEAAAATLPAAVAPPDTAADTAAMPEKRKFTVAEYYRMAEVGILGSEERVELIEGEVLVMAPPGPMHAGDVMRSTEVFAWRRDERFVVQVQNPLRLDDGSEPEPDVMLLRRREDYYTTAHPTPADTLLVMEVADSSLEYDRGTKAHIYGRAGVPQTLVANLPGDCVEGFEEPGPEGYARHTIYRRGDKIRLVALPDLEVAVEDLLPPVAAEPGEAAGPDG